MSRYLVARLLQVPVVVFVVSIVLFLAIHASGDPAMLMSPADATPEAIEALRVQMGLTEPLPVQYIRLHQRLLTGELRSFVLQRSPLALVIPHVLRSMQVALPALAFSILIAVPAGVLAATRRGSFWDSAILGVALLGQAIPVFLLGVLMMWLFSVKLRWLPVSGTGTWKHYVLPVASLGAYGLAILLRLTRSAVLEVLEEDYIRTARGKGLSDAAVNFKHALRTALIPVISLMGVQLATLVSGALVVETIFSWPGIGKLIYDGVIQRDIPLVVVVGMSIAVLVTFINFLVDVCYGLADPRIRYG